MLMARATRRWTALIAADSALIVGAVVLAGYVRLEPRALLASALLPKALLVAVVCQLCLYSRDVYEGRIGTNRQELFVRFFQGLGVTSVVLAAVYYWFPHLIIGSGVVAAAVALIALLISGWRAAFDWATTRFGPHERLLFVGTD